MERAALSSDTLGPFSPEVREQLIAWLSLPDQSRPELLCGRIVYRAMANLDHGAAQAGISAQIFGSQGPDGMGNRWWIGVETDIYVGGEGMRPDVVGWRIERHPEPPKQVSLDRHLGVIVAPPDWVCEVLSTSTASRDLNVKWQAYHRAGVGWYWIVDVLNRSVTVYRRNDTSYELVHIAVGGEIAHLAPFEEHDFVPERLFIRPPGESTAATG